MLDFGFNCVSLETTGEVDSLQWIAHWVFCFLAGLTDGAQGHVAEDDDDENDTADHISAAPGGRKENDSDD